MAQTVLLTLINVKIDNDESRKSTPHFSICNESFSNENTSMETHKIFLRVKHIRFMYYFGHACPSFDSLGLSEPVALSRSGSEAERKQSYVYDRGQVPTATWARYFTYSNHRAGDPTIIFHAVYHFYLCNKAIC
jgi:hypothetical protein